MIKIYSFRGFRFFLNHSKQVDVKPTWPAWIVNQTSNLMLTYHKAIFDDIFIGQHLLLDNQLLPASQQIVNTYFQ